MKRWLILAAGLYPRDWRERYGEEFGALLDDVRPTWRMLSDVLRGGLKMQLKSGTLYWKLAGAMAIVGALVAGGISYRVPPRYVSTAVLRVTPQTAPVRATTVESAKEAAALHVRQLEEQVLTRSSLSAIIQQPSFDLYKEERTTEPLEDIIQKMRTHDLQVHILPSRPGTLDGVMAFTVSYTHPDREKAQAVVRVVVTKFLEQNITSNQQRLRAWQVRWPSVQPPPNQNLTVIDPASLPDKPVAPNRVVFMAWGLTLGLLVGLFTAMVLRRPRTTLQLAGCAAAGCLLAGGASFLIPDRYTSTAVMRFSQPGGQSVAAADKLNELEHRVLSRQSLETVITDFRLDLYHQQRTRQPMEEIVDRMRKDIRIQTVNPGTAFSISFTYPDKYKVQAGVRGLLTRFTEESVTLARSATGEQRHAENLEVLDPASLPETPISPNRYVIAGAGLALGLLAGLALFRRPSVALSPA